MKKTFFLTLAAWCLVHVATSQEIYRFSVTDDRGQMVNLDRYHGNVLLIINTATRCGFTPQYRELEDLYERYNEKGFEILDFPCNQFGEQAPGTIEEIHQYCSANFAIHFPQFDKVEVNGPNEIPLYTYLKSQLPFNGFDMDHPLGKVLDEMMRKQDPYYDKNADIKWNFTKFLVDRDGRVVARFEPTADMKVIERSIQELLGLVR